MDDNIKERLEYLRGEIRAERISYGEIAELADLAEHIEPGDVELLEWAGVPEHPPVVALERFELSIELGDDAMQTPDQVAVALRQVAERLTGRGDFEGDESGTIIDFNGNTVGTWEAK